MSGRDPRSSLAGRLLVATPLIEEPIFRRTVIWVLHHDIDGALGVVLNRPSDMPVDEPFPGWENLAAHPAVMFSGGPVSQTSVVCLAEAVAGATPAGFTPVVPGFGTLDLEGTPDTVGPAVSGLRMFAGYAGWSPGQLEEELAEGAWIVADARPEDLLTDVPIRLWRTVLRRQPGRTRLLAAYPPDVRLQ